MKKLLSLCLMLVVLSMSLLTSCSVNYKPISLKYRNSDYAPYTDGEPKSFLVDLLNNSKWHNDVAKCDCDYTVMMTNTREIFYHSECGTFIDYDFDRSLTVSEEDRVKLNGYFAAIMCESNVHCFDDNYRCTACGYVTLEHEHTYEYDHDNIGHGWSYTCGCMTPPNFAQHFDGDGDGKCDEDSCRYDMSENLTPTNHFLRNQAGCEWLNEITAEDIAELKMTVEYEGVGPGTMRDVSSSTLTNPISRILSEFSCMGVTAVSRDEAIVPGGSNLIVEFVLKDGTEKELIFYNGCYHDTVNDVYYRLDYRPAFNYVSEYTSYCQFVTIGEWDKCEVWCDTPIMVPYFVCDIPLEELKFYATDYNVGVGVSEYEYFIETDFGRLGFIRNDVFFIVGSGGSYYQLVGKNLDELIAEYSNK